MCERVSAVVFCISHLDLDLYPEKHTQRKLHTETSTCRFTNTHAHIAGSVDFFFFPTDHKLSHTLLLHYCTQITAMRKV